MIIRSLCYGYLGAALGGLVIGVAGAIFGTSLDTIVAAASPKTTAKSSATDHT